MSGDGEYVAGRNNTCIPSTAACGISLPPGNGGGCVNQGPFKEYVMLLVPTQTTKLTLHSWSVNLGPVAPVLANFTANPSFDGLGYNPRCLRRDISRAAAHDWSKGTHPPPPSPPGTHTSR